MGDGVHAWTVLEYFLPGSLGVAGVTSVDGRAGIVTLADLYAAISHTHAQSAITNLVSDLAAKASVTSLTTHISDTANPHAVTKAQVGLANVDNTADTAKPVSTAQQTALDAKASTSSLNAHLADVLNPHGVTKSQVGLSNVDNTADTAKPVSTAQQTALDLKAPIASPTFTGTATVADVAVTGRLRQNYDTLSDASTIAVDGSLGNRFEVTVTGDHILGNPTNMVHGQPFLILLRQDGTGGHVVTLGNKYRDPNGYYTGLSATAGDRAYIGGVYDTTDDQFDVLAFVKGY